MEGATGEGNQSTGNQLPSEEKSQGKEKVSTNPLGRVTSRLQCRDPVDELPRREVRGALLGWWGRACLPLSLAQMLFTVGVISTGGAGLSAVMEQLLCVGAGVWSSAVSEVCVI